MCWWWRERGTWARGERRATGRRRREAAGATGWRAGWTRWRREATREALGDGLGAGGRARGGGGPGGGSQDACPIHGPGEPERCDGGPVGPVAERGREGRPAHRGLAEEAGLQARGGAGAGEGLRQEALPQAQALPDAAGGDDAPGRARAGPGGGQGLRGPGPPA